MNPLRSTTNEYAATTTTTAPAVDQHPEFHGNRHPRQLSKFKFCAADAYPAADQQQRPSTEITESTVFDICACCPNLYHTPLTYISAPQLPHRLQ